MLNINLYEYGKMAGRNDDYAQTQQNNKVKVLDTIIRIASEHDNFPIDGLIKLIEKEDVVLGYIINENKNITDDKKAQDLICDILPSYDEEEIDTILSELNC